VTLGDVDVLEAIPVLEIAVVAFVPLV